VEPTSVRTKDELIGLLRLVGVDDVRVLDSTAARLRRKLTADGDRFIANVWGVGYRLVG
jgi:DNA-binding response OmpR family regulator